MTKTDYHIEIVRSTTKGLSSLSQESAEAIGAVLSRHFTKVGITAVNTTADLQGLAEACPDLVFLGAEFIPNDLYPGSGQPNKLWLSDFLDNQGIAYTGSSQKAHRLGRYKPLAKQRVLEAGLKSADFTVIGQDQALKQSDISLNYPLFVKPANCGGGRGIDSQSVAHNFEQLQSKVNSIKRAIGSDVLIEEYLAGREFSVAILKDDLSSELLALPIELVAPLDLNGDRLLSDKVKSSNTEQALGVSDTEIKSKVSELALAVFEALGARDYGRIDIRLDLAGRPHFLEANLIPSLISGYGSFPKACILNIGLDYEPMIMQIVNLGLARKLKPIRDIIEPLTIADTVFPASDVDFDIA